MTVTRRDFVKQTSLASAVIAGGSPRVSGLPAPVQRRSDPAIKELCVIALDAARSAGAAYADIRVVRRRSQRIATRDDRVTAISDGETFGFGVRVLAKGAWGFVASKELSRRGVTEIARRAVDQAGANGAGVTDGVVLAPVDAYPDSKWQSPISVDPFAVPVEDKVDLLLTANTEALRVRGARFVSSSMFFLREEKTFASTEGTITEQTIYRSAPSMQVTAVAPDFSNFQTRASTEVSPMGLGYEHVLDADFPGRAPLWAEDAVAMLSATSVEAGEYDLILDPSHLFLTIHESIGHPTELDRALGYEANYAGTSFLSPPSEMIGNLRYGPEFMNVQGDRTQQGALATVGWDDEGVPADSWPIIKDGVFVDYQTTREQAGWISEYTGVTRSHGCSYAQSWDRVQFQRMPNVSLLPGDENRSIDDLIAATERGIVIKGRGSYSIDQQRYNFQFGGQVFEEVRGGKVVGRLRDVAYQGQTIPFWNSMDMIGGPGSYQLAGTASDGKGQPSQSNAVSHGCPPARFRNVTVINTAR